MCVCVCFAINKYIIAWTIDGGLQSCEFTCNFVVTFCTVRRVVGMWGVTDVWATRDATVMPMMDACNRFAAYLWIDRATHAHYPQIEREKKRIVSCARWKRFFHVNQFPFTKVSTVEWTKNQIRYDSIHCGCGRLSMGLRVSSPMHTDWAFETIKDHLHWKLQKIN